MTSLPIKVQNENILVSNIFFQTKLQ